MYNIHLNNPGKNDILSMFSFLEQNPQYIEQFNKMNKVNQTLNYNNGNLGGDQNPVNTSLNFNLGNNDKGIKRNIVFSTGSGRRFNVVASENMTMKELFKEFILKIGLTVDVLDDLMFLSNGSKFDVNCEETIKQKGIFDSSHIIVIDSKRVIGAN